VGIVVATEKQRAAARKNIKKAQAAWKAMSHEEHARSQPQGRGRSKPGATGEGEFYRIVVRPEEEFVTFRTQDVGSKGHVERVAGKRESGSWDTQAWLVSKKDAHTEGDRLVPDTAGARELLAELGSEPKPVKGDVFEAKDRPDVPESEKPTEPLKRARRENIKKAQVARHEE
jgi:hypothetical protein